MRVGVDVRSCGRSGLVVVVVVVVVNGDVVVVTYLAW